MRRQSIKHILGVILMSLGGVGLMGCENKKESISVSNEPESKVVVIEGKPDYSNYKETNVMRLAAWVSPPPANWNGKGNPNFITDEQYKVLQESGLNSIYALYENNNLPATIAACELASNHNIKYYVRDTHVFYVDPVLMELEPGEWKNNENVLKYSGYDSFAGHLITDEPSAKDFEKLGRIKEFYDKEMEGKDFYVNLFPTYATLSQLGTDSYEQYIQQYIDVVKPDYISYDHYALMVDGYGKKKITDDVLYNLEIVASKCKEAGIYMITFAQSMSYNESSRNPTEQEIRWQVMTELAYGTKGIQYFCYWTPIEWGDDVGSPAMITHDGQKTENYDNVAKVNKEIAALDEAYLNFEWEGTMAIEGSEGDSTNKAYKLLEHPLENHEMIKNISASQDTLVGTYKGKDGRSAFLFTNFEDPANKKEDNVEVTFYNATKALIYHYGNEEVVNLVNGKLNYKLDPGDGIFVIPYR